MYQPSVADIQYLLRQLGPANADSVPEILALPIAPHQRDHGPDLFEGFYSRTFRCPFEEKCRFYRRNQGNACIFRHFYGVGENFVALPDFVCLNFLLDSCREELHFAPQREGNFGGRAVDACPNDECRFGIHVTFRELRMGFESNAANWQRIENYRAQFPDQDYRCIICRENIRLDCRVPQRMQFCILDGCNHVHCKECALQNRLTTADGLVACALRCGTNKVIFQQFEGKIRDQREKAASFRYVTPQRLYPPGYFAFMQAGLPVEILYNMEW